MDHLIGNLVSRIRKDDSCVTSDMDGNALVIRCMECGLMPEPGSDECMRCMVEQMSASGGAERIILRTGRDLEISGDSARAIRSAASLRRWSIPVKEKELKCRRCDRSRSHVMAALWDSFPALRFTYAHDMLAGADGDAGCQSCVRMTGIALERLETDIDRIRAELLR